MEQQLVRAHGVYRYFPAQADGNTIVIYDPHDASRVLERFTFPRQPGGQYLCLADFVRPVDSGEMDAVAFFVVTCPGVRAWPRTRTLAPTCVRMPSRPWLLNWLKRMRKSCIRTCGPGGVSRSARDDHARSFSGKVSRPARLVRLPRLPDLEDQAKLFALLHPEDIGVQLTEGYMMDPEASVSALVFHHPEADYFRADRASEQREGN